MSLTITEALAELKTIDKRLEKKREFVTSYLYRQERLRDPLEKDGGSVAAVKREMQAISDLEDRKVAIRRAIAHANETTAVKVGDQTKTIAEWLTWRRDVAPFQRQFFAGLRSRLDSLRRDAQQKGLSVNSAGEAKSLDDITVNVSETELASRAEKLEETLGVLDGQLSLKNATVTLAV